MHCRHTVWDRNLRWGHCNMQQLQRLLVSSRTTEKLYVVCACGRHSCLHFCVQAKWREEVGESTLYHMVIVIRLFLAHWHRTRANPCRCTCTSVHPSQAQPFCLCEGHQHHRPCGEYFICCEPVRVEYLFSRFISSISLQLPSSILPTKPIPSSNESFKLFQQQALEKQKKVTHCDMWTVGVILPVISAIQCVKFPNNLSSFDLLILVAHVVWSTHTL